MATVLLSLLSEEGHLNPTYKVARGLRDRGHRVLYLASEDLKEPVGRQGFELVPLFPDLEPAGFLEQQRARRRQARGLRQTLREIRGHTAHRRSFFGRWLDGSAERLLADIGPDLVIADSLFPLMALAAHRLGIPVVLLNVVLPGEPELGIPPADSALVPAEDLAGRLRVALTWRKSLFESRLSQLAARILGCDEDYPGVLRAVARRSGLPPERIAGPVLRPVLRLPEIVLCPRELDFPHPEIPDRHYVEPSIDLDRAPRPFPWERIDPAKTLIYCSMGSQAFRAGKAMDVIRLAIDAVRGRDDWQLVATVGPDGASRHPAPPPNAILVESAPQLELLQKAAVTITHGGLGSVKESVYFGVPMLVFPLMRDQPGNAARIVYHGLGLRGTPSAEAVRADLRRILEDGPMRERVQAFSRRFRQLESERPSLRIVESLLN